MSTLWRERGDTYVSDEGWSVRVLGRTGLEYRRAERVMRIDSELLAHPHGAAVYTRSIRWWQPPHDDVPVTDAERAEGLVLTCVGRAASPVTLELP